ncbi:phosphatidic acid phosphatase/chloroperoxidase [Tanacetum coccineum]
MSRAALMPFSANPLPTLKHKCKCIDIFRTTVVSCPSFYTLKESAIAYKETVKHKKTMEVSELKLRGLIDNNSALFHQTSNELHTTLNRLSKWIVSGTLCGIILLRHDSLALWAATGSVSNFILSITLKKILKQERPVSEVSSGHGMPSSHSQSIFFAVVFVILSVNEWMGSNGATTILSVLIVALGSYFVHKGHLSIMAADFTALSYYKPSPLRHNRGINIFSLVVLGMGSNCL